MRREVGLIQRELLTLLVAAWPETVSTVVIAKSLGREACGLGRYLARLVWNGFVERVGFGSRCPCNGASTILWRATRLGTVVPAAATIPAAGQARIYRLLNERGPLTTSAIHAAYSSSARTATLRRLHRMVAMGLIQRVGHRGREIVWRLVHTAGASARPVAEVGSGPAWHGPTPPSMAAERRPSHG